MRILGISGSLRRDSYNTGLLRTAALLAPLELRPVPAPEPAVLRRLAAPARSTVSASTGKWSEGSLSR